MQRNDTVKPEVKTDIQAEDLRNEDLELFSDELEERGNAAVGTIFCASTEGCVCTFSSYL